MRAAGWMRRRRGAEGFAALVDHSVRGGIFREVDEVGRRRAADETKPRMSSAERLASLCRSLRRISPSGFLSFSKTDSGTMTWPGRALLLSPFHTPRRANSAADWFHAMVLG